MLCCKHKLVLKYIIGSYKLVGPFKLFIYIPKKGLFPRPVCKISLCTIQVTWQRFPVTCSQDHFELRQVYLNTKAYVWIALNISSLKQQTYLNQSKNTHSNSQLFRVYIHVQDIMKEQKTTWQSLMTLFNLRSLRILKFTIKCQTQKRQWEAVLIYLCEEMLVCQHLFYNLSNGVSQKK